MTYDSAQQLVSCYETLGMTPEQTADSLGLDVAVVKAGLMQFSARYRKALKQEDGDALDFSQDEQALAKQTLLDLMQFSEDQHLRGRLARYIRDDAKGRLEKDSVGGMLKNGANINITLVQQHLSQVQERLSMRNTKAIPIPAREAKMLADAKISTTRQQEEAVEK